MTEVAHDLVHIYEFKVHDFLSNYKNDIIKSFIESKTPGNDSFYFNKELYDFILPKLNDIVETHYWVGPRLGYPYLNTYIQNHQNYRSNYHQHMVMQSGCISGVFYIDPPQTGGEISFLIDPELPPLNIQPEKDKLYLFPSWVFHKPLPQKDEKYRVCFNWAYPSNVRPIHKHIATLW